MKRHFSTRFSPFPSCFRGMRIGLFGGSFDPPHEGHMMVAKTAFRSLNLHQIWWIITPGNPFKDRASLPLSARCDACAALDPAPNAIVTTLEATLGHSRTRQTIQALKKRLPDVYFVWIMGADSFLTLHKWQNWRALIHAIPFLVIDRPGSTLRRAPALNNPLLKRRFYAQNASRKLPFLSPPAVIFYHSQRNTAASSALRRATHSSKNAGV